MGVLLAPASIVGAAATASAAAPGPASCGNAALPGGTYTSLDVTGNCTISAGPVTVTGNVTVEAGASLVAAYALNNSALTVIGNVKSASGATVVLGCEASNFPCFDDPGNPASPTLNSSDNIQGSVLATSPLGVIIHKSTITGDVGQTGGGGGLTCAPSGPFVGFGSPVYSDYEDNTILGNLRATGLTSCWFGAIRNYIGASATLSNNSLADPDANENLANFVAGNLICASNNPAVQYGDSGSTPNTVGGFGSGQCAFGVTQPSPPPSGTKMPIAQSAGPRPGYWTVAQDGGIFAFGVPFLGSKGGQSISGTVVGMGSSPGGTGYAMASTTGAVYTFGNNTADCTGVGGPLNKPIVGIATAPGGNGCWLAASDGGVFALGGNAPFFGSAGALSLVKPIVGISATPGNDGYDLVASDGGVFTYGPGATFYGSMGGQHLNQPIVGIAIDPATGGYWMVAKDGGIFAFNAPFFGSMGGKPLNQPIVGMAATPTGDGYYLVAADGGIFAFNAPGGSSATFHGSTGNIHLNQPITGMTVG
ncbi:MAG: hypothetical protein JO368_11970 [Acidimicrobiales bacterium]|nr:hypothetical protein [Acidimicrobiales bacterium]